MAGMTILGWQSRFENAAPPLDLQISPGLPGWSLEKGHRLMSEREAVVIPVQVGSRTVLAEKDLKHLEGARFVHIQVESKWENIVRKDDRTWLSARLSLADKRHDGTYHWPQDGDIINATGTRDWHKFEMVLDLPHTVEHPHLTIFQLAESGQIRLKNLCVTPVKQRTWMPAAGFLLLSLWSIWFACLVWKKAHPWRSIATTSLLVAGTGLLVFPQPHHHARSFPGGFLLGKTIPPSPPPTPAESPTPIQPTTLPNPPPPPQSKTSIPHPKPVSESTTRTEHTLATTAREIDNAFPIAHLVIFTALAWLLFTLGGVPKTIGPAISIAVLSETIPNLIRHDFHFDDSLDLISNLCGVALGYWLFLRLSTKLRKKSQGTRPGSVS